MKIEVRRARQFHFNCGHKPERGSLFRIVSGYCLVPGNVRDLYFYGSVESAEACGGGWLVTCSEMTEKEYKAREGEATSYEGVDITSKS